MFHCVITNRYYQESPDFHTDPIITPIKEIYEDGEDRYKKITKVMTRDEKNCLKKC